MDITVHVRINAEKFPKLAEWILSQKNRSAAIRGVLIQNLQNRTTNEMLMRKLEEMENGKGRVTD